MIMSPRLFAAAAVTIASVLAAACSDPDRAAAEAAVRAYNEALVLAYRTSDPAPVEPLVTRKELGKLIALIDLKTAAGLVLESTLEELEVTSVEKTDPEHMVVRTGERWRYFDRPRKPGAAPSQEFVARMTLEYTFVTDGVEWRMDQARTLENEYLEPPGYSHTEPDGRGTPEQGEES
jgi:hypothetical protein